MAAASSRCSRRVIDLGTTAGAPGGRRPPLDGLSKWAAQAHGDTWAADSMECEGLLRDGLLEMLLARRHWMFLFQGTYLIVKAAVATAPAPTLRRLPPTAENRTPFGGHHGGPATQGV